MRARVWLFCAVSCLVACSESAGEPASDNTGKGGQVGSSGGSSAASGGATGASANQGGAGGSAGKSGGTGGGAGSSSGGTSGAQNSSGGSQNSSGGSQSTSGGSAGTGKGEIDCRNPSDGKTTLGFINRCEGQLSVRGSRIADAEIEPGGFACRDLGSAAESIPTIRYWGFIGKDPGPERYTLAELTLNTDFYDLDFYNISHVDAHNLPMQIVPVGKSDCRTLTCAEDLIPECPAEGQVRDAQNVVVSCFSPNRDDPQSAVAQYFEASCEDAYSWSGDDTESMAACATEDYDVIFCP